MDLLALISFLSVASLWFFSTEYGNLSGVFGPTCVVNRTRFNLIVAAVFLAALCGEYLLFNGEAGSTADGQLRIAFVPLILMLLSSLLILGILKLFRVRGSFCYAFTGSLYAFLIAASPVGCEWRYVISFVAAPFIVFLFALCIRAFLKALVSGRNIHMVKLSWAMRHVVIVGIVLIAAALGLNWGGFLLDAGNMLIAADNVNVLLIVVALSGTSMIFHMCSCSGKDDEPTGMFADFSIYAVVSVGLSVALTLIFFSFEEVTSIVGLYPVPLSVSAMVMAAVAGVETVQRTRIVDDEDYVKEAVAMTGTPVGAFLLTSASLYIASLDGGDNVADFTIMAFAVAGVLCVFFMGYVRRQHIYKEGVDRLLYVQQQQIYEHSRALNDMEMKVILSENRALHDAVELKKQEVTNVALSIKEQKEYLESLNEMVRKMVKTEDNAEREELLEKLDMSLKQRLSYDSEVDSQYFYAQAESLHEDFHAKLSERFPDLTPQETRLATMLRLGFSSKYISTLMNVTPKSIEISRYRLRQKLRLSKGDNLVNFLKSI